MADLLRARGFGVWRDDDLPPHRAFGDVIEERLRAARAVVVLWSADAARSHWVRAEAELARQLETLVQATLDGSPLPLPFSQVQCADLTGWNGDPDAPALRKLLQSIGELTDRPSLERSDTSPPAPAAASEKRRTGDGRPVVAVMEGGASTALGQDLVAEVCMALGRHAVLRLCEGEAGRPDYRVEIVARQSGDRARISARLVAAADNGQVWSERYDRETSDPFALLDEVSEAISANVEAQLRRASIASALAASDRDDQRLPAAMAAVNRMDAAGYRDALAILAPDLEATEPEAEALALAALAHACLWGNGYPGTGAKNLDAGRALARRALRQTDIKPFVAGLSAVALAMLGAPPAASMAIAERVLQMNPGFAPAHLWAGQVQLLAGNAGEAIARLEAAQRLDPRMTVRPLLLGWLGAARMVSGDHEVAAASLLEAVELAGGLAMNLLFLAATLGHLGRMDEGRAVLAEARALAPPEDFRLALPGAMQQLLRDGLAALA